ncbi:hypothetical protein HGM15179_004085 [Zosterops borbonicus]|uniref:YqaJ viral recombinase domain-containing protein n=1 Tax=Zosterops borbonicus TaxID=364589 RepID=A0A8K1GPW8_9PASS|nr:hypothetical protein HGM15179_004085 [Zosterops borbonicus]
MGARLVPGQKRLLRELLRVPAEAAPGPLCPRPVPGCRQRGENKRPSWASCHCTVTREPGEGVRVAVLAGTHCALEQVQGVPRKGEKAPDAKGAAGPAKTDLSSQKKQPRADLSKACDQFLPPVKGQDISRVEKETRGQRENPKWYEWRENRITASVAPKIANSKFANSKTDEVPKSYLKEVVSSGSKVQTPAMSWGILNEKVAVEAYKQKSQKGGKPVQVEDCGLFIHPEKNWLAASPDGIIKDAATGKDLGLLEVKCPYKHRNRTVREACKDKNFCLEVDGDSYALKKNHPYFTQVQCQLGTTGFQRADFVVHTNKETAVVPVEFDREFWGKTVPKLEKFYTEAVIPHLEQKAGSSVWAKEE